MREQSLLLRHANVYYKVIQITLETCILLVLPKHYYNTKTLLLLVLECPLPSCCLEGSLVMHCHLVQAMNPTKCHVLIGMAEQVIFGKEIQEGRERACARKQAKVIERYNEHTLLLHHSQLLFPLAFRTDQDQNLYDSIERKMLDVFKINSTCWK